MADMTKYQETAVSAALKAGKLLKELLGKAHEVKFKGEIDLVTEADFQAEKLIIQEIKKKFPDHNFLSEEKGKEGIDSQFLWLIDPLDGTTNFAHRFPFFAVSIALSIQEEINLGVVYDPNFDELFLAEKGRRAFLNNKPIAVSKNSDLSKTLLATGFPYYVRERPDRPFESFRNFYFKTQGVRRCGSAALDLCYVACGRFDGFWEEGLKPWDTAAGSLILKEAGGTLTRFDGSDFDLYFPEVVASNSLIHNQMLKVLNPAFTTDKPP